MKVKAIKDTKIGNERVYKDQVFDVVDQNEDTYVLVGYQYAVRKKYFEVIDEGIVMDSKFLMDIPMCTAGHEGACWFAKGDDCKCACMGRNHGIGLKFDTFEEAERHYLETISVGIKERGVGNER